MPIDSEWIAGAGTQGFDTAANWRGAVPTVGQDASIAAGVLACELTDDMDQSALDLALLSVGEEWKGKIGTPASHLVLGDTGKLRINAPQASTINIGVAAEHTITVAEIFNTSPGPYGCHLLGPGTYATLNILAGQFLYLAADIVVTELYIDGGVALIDPGAAIGTIDMSAGVCQNKARIITALNLSGGVFKHLGDAGSDGAADYGDIGNGAGGGTATIWGGMFEMRSRGGVIDNLHIKRGGTVDGTLVGHENTITAGTMRRGGILKLNTEAVIDSNFISYGGWYSGPSGITESIPSMRV